MLLVLVTAVAGLVVTVLVKVVDLVVEGRGSWARRAIRADVELLKELPDDVRKGRGGAALVERIEASLVVFSATDTGEKQAEDCTRQVDSEQAQRRRQFRSEVSAVEVRLNVLAIVLATAVTAAVSFSNGHRPTPWSDISLGDGLIIFGAATACTTATVFVTNWLAVRIVRRRWRAAGRPLPGTPPTVLVSRLKR